MTDNRKTVATLMNQLKCLDQDAVVDFGPLDFYRFKPRGPGVVQAEFQQNIIQLESGYFDIQGPAETPER